MASRDVRGGLVSPELEARTIAWRRHLHANHPRFDIDEAALRLGAAVFVRTALDALV